MIIETVNEDNIRAAAEVHAAAWRESHRSFCSPEFVKLHTVERQECYIRGKRMAGSRFFLLTEEMPLGVVSITDSVVEDLYILPAYQNRSYGTRLLQFAIGECKEVPKLWILSHNSGAERLYRRTGFLPTGEKKQLSETVFEIEFSYHKQ